MMKHNTVGIDAHVHLWRLANADYDWIQPGSYLDRDFELDELAATLSGCQVERVVVVQSANDEGDTTWMRFLAGSDHRVAGVVGWVDLRKAAALREIDDIAGDPKVVGIRQALSPAIFREIPNAVLVRLAEAELVLEVLDGLSAADAANRAPALSIVVEHLGMPPVEGKLDDWRRAMIRAGGHARTYVKVSALHRLPPERRAICITEARRIFGHERMLFGSNWPVCLERGLYGDEYGLARRILADVPSVFGQTATEVYRLAARAATKSTIDPAIPT
jgi:L-fucono-1,5-lactonase